MSLALWAAIADLILFTPAPAAPRAELAARYASACAGPRAAEAECKRLQWQLEQRLYEDLRAGAPATPETWRVAAGAEVPGLAVLGLRRVGESYAPADEALLLAQLDSPFPAVRDAVFEVAEEVGAQRVLRLRPRRVVDGRRASFPIADEIPSVERLGAPAPPSATFRPFASDGARATFTSEESVEQVAAFYVRQGRRAFTPAELEAEKQRRKQAALELQRNPQAMAARMQEAMAAGKDPQQAMMDFYASFGGVDKDFMTGLAVEEGVTQLRFVPLDEGMTRMALLFRDELLGRTAIVFLDVPTAGYLELHRRMTASPPDTELLLRRAEAEQLLARPLIDGGR